MMETSDARKRREEREAATQAYTVTRDVEPDECRWLPDTVPAGITVYRCTRPTYGCISWTGVAVTLDPAGGYPFFELPRDAIEGAS